MSNKNLYGFALFAFIIVTTIVLNSIFLKPTIKGGGIYTAVSQSEVSSEYNRYPLVRAHNIEQAVLNLKTKTVELDLDLNKRINFDAEDGFAVALNFYTKDANPSKITTQTVWVQPNMIDSSTKTAKVRLISPFSLRLNSFRRGQTLYIIPVAAPSSYDAAQIPAGFDKSDAIPVLIVNK